jgi:hypothetical protein
MKSRTRKQRYNAIISAATKDMNACVIELAESYLKDFPDSQGAWDMYSRALYRIDRFKDAKKAVSKAIELIDEPDKQQRLDGFFLEWDRFMKNQGIFVRLLNGMRKLINQIRLRRRF